MANRKNTLLLKRSNVAGKIPASGDLLLGELAINTSDAILYASGTTSNTILPIGWDRVSRTGDTMTGTLNVPTISATTYLNLPTTTFTGGTVTGNTQFTGGLSAATLNINNYIDFNTGTTTPSNISGRVYYDNQSHALAYFPDISQNVKVEMGQQLYIRGYNNTGAIIPKGTALSIESSINGLPNLTPALMIHRMPSQVVGLAASDIPISSNGLALSQGILSGLTLNTFSVGDILYLSPFSAGTYVSTTSSFPYTARTNQIGYVISTGTTIGQIYVSINNENENLTLTDIERNILEGNVISSGVYEYSGMTQGTGQTINIATIRGWIVRNTYDFSTLPDVVNILYTGGTNIPLTNLNSADATYILINSASTIVQQITSPTPQQRRENVLLGKVVHPNRNTITSINQTVDFDVSPMAAIRDLWSPLKLINQGVLVSANGVNMNINTSAGTLWGNGVGWTINQLNPNSVSISGQSPTTFQYRTQLGPLTGGTVSTGNTTTIDPAYYDLNGVVTAVGGGGNASTNQRVYLFPTGLVRIQLGQKVYSNLAAAVTASQTETFVEYGNNRDNGILIGILSVNKNASVGNGGLVNANYAVFNLVSKFGEVLGGTGGLSTTTLQQAYDNSSNPEIITSATLDGLQIRGGTGSDTAANIIVENNAGNPTGQWLANGSLSATTIITIGTRLSNSGLTASTISATTYQNLPTDIRTTGGTYSNNVFTFTNNTGGTYTTLFNTVSGLTVNGGLTVTGNTSLQALTASTVSANTAYFTDLVVSAGTQSLFSGSSSVEMVRIVQAGSGDAFVVEDSANNDFSHFVVNSSGNVCVGLTQPFAGDKLTVSGNTTVFGTLSGSSVAGVYVSPYVTIGAAYTATTANSTIEISGGTFTLALYTAVGNTGRTIYIKNSGSGLVTVDANASETIDGQLTRPLGNLEDLLIQSNGTNWVILNRKPVVMQFAHDSVSVITPADATTYYIGNFVMADPATTSGATRQVIALSSGWVRSATLMISVAGTLGSAGSSTFSLKNVTTGADSIISSTVAHTSVAQLLSFTLATPMLVRKGDLLQINWLTPTWATNPSSVRQALTILVE